MTTLGHYNLYVFVNMGKFISIVLVAFIKISKTSNNEHHSGKKPRIHKTKACCLYQWFARRTDIAANNRRPQCGQSSIRQKDSRPASRWVQVPRIPLDGEARGQVRG